MRFHRVDPHPGETRRYVTDTGYGDGTYVITREMLGGWTAWVIQNPDDPAVTTRGWLAVARGYKTMSAARIAAYQHRDRLFAEYEARVSVKTTSYR